MWTYEKRLEYPVNITKRNSNQNRKVAGILTDIGVSVGKLRMEECLRQLGIEAQTHSFY